MEAHTLQIYGTVLKVKWDTLGCGRRERGVGGKSWPRLPTRRAVLNCNAYWPPTLQTSSTLGKEPLKSVKSHTVTVEIETPRRAPLGESVVVTGLELTGFITGAAKVGAFEVGVFDVTPLIPPD
jgi:hypothetical protein